MRHSLLLGLISLLEIVMSSSVLFRSLGGSNMFGEKTWENVQGIFMLKLYPDFVVLFFIFTSFNTTRVILLVKIIKFEIASQLKVINSGALMLVCRWASVNDLVQNKFRSIIHLLSQHLLAQSHWRKHQMNVQDLWKFTIMTPEQSHWRHWHHSVVLTVNSEHILQLALVFLVFLLLTLNK